MIAIIDYDAGNIRSVEKALQYLGEETVCTGERDVILQADKVILPGVGAFGDAMKKLRNRKLDEVIWEVVENKTPFLGICLGLQLLFESSEESKGIDGLGILPGRIVRLPEAKGLKVPHVGWNSLHFPSEGTLFHGIAEGAYVYCVHSFYLQAEEAATVKATTQYGVTVHASVERDNVFACQFHPEKSSDTGLKILNNFITFTGREG